MISSDALTAAVFLIRLMQQQVASMQPSGIEDTLD